MPGRSAPQHPAQASRRGHQQGLPDAIVLLWSPLHGKPLFLNRFSNDGQVFDLNLRLLPTLLQ